LVSDRDPDRRHSGLSHRQEAAEMVRPFAKEAPE
jgi:hypothetical protein